MQDAQFAEFVAWISEAGLSGQTETALLAGFCDRALGLGLPLARTTVLIDTLSGEQRGSGGRPVWSDVRLSTRAARHRGYNPGAIFWKEVKTEQA
jgi:hypothetical protein